MRNKSIAGAAAVCGFVLSLGGCANPPSVPIGLTDVVARPAEGALLAGMRAYDDAQYSVAEQRFIDALARGLVSAHDQAAAHKYLAFIYCTSDRATACEQEFRAARASDPGFALSRAESGHPQWGPVFQRVRQ